MVFTISKTENKINNELTKLHVYNDEVGNANTMSMKEYPSMETDNDLKDSDDDSGEELSNIKMGSNPVKASEPIASLNNPSTYNNERHLYNINSAERQILKEGDVYNSTVKANSLTSLTIGPVVEQLVRKHRRTSTCDTTAEIMNESPESEISPTCTDYSSQDTILEGSSDEEEEYSSGYSEKSGDHPASNQYDTKVNIKMPNEGPPKIDINQQITNHYQGPVFQLDAEATKAILLADPNIIAHICQREMVNMPKIKHNASKQNYQERFESAKHYKDTTIPMEEENNIKKLPENEKWPRKICRTRNRKGQDSPSNDNNKVCILVFILKK